jgi:hypothetical protein
MKQEQVQKTRKASTDGRRAAEQDRSGTTDRARGSRASSRARRTSRSAAWFLARTEAS